MTEMAKGGSYSNCKSIFNGMKRKVAALKSQIKVDTDSDDSSSDEEV